MGRLQAFLCLKDEIHAAIKQGLKFSQQICTFADWLAVGSQFRSLSFYSLQENLIDGQDLFATFDN